jgi:hypothetical protein
LSINDIAGAVIKLDLMTKTTDIVYDAF